MGQSAITKQFLGVNTIVRDMQTNTSIINDSSTHEREKRNQRHYYMKQICIMPPTELLYFPCTLLWGVGVCMFFLFGFVFLGLFLNKTMCINKAYQVKTLFYFKFWKWHRVLLLPLFQHVTVISLSTRYQEDIDIYSIKSSRRINRISY